MEYLPLGNSKRVTIMYLAAGNLIRKGWDLYIEGINCPRQNPAIYITLHIITLTHV